MRLSRTVVKGGAAACTGAGAQHGGAGREANFILSCRRTSIMGPPVGGLFGFKFHLGVTFLKCICNNFALAGDAVLALGDEPLSLTGSLISPNPPLPPASPLRMPGSST